MDTKELFGLFSSILNIISLLFMIHDDHSPLSVIHDSPKDDDEHGDAVDPDVELPGGGADGLKLSQQWHVIKMNSLILPGAGIP